jgi:superfamily I DNA/RNA helicase
VDHHDKAYAWAERRKLETHPKTGAAQLVEVRETVREIVIHQPVQAPKPAAQAKTPFTDFSDNDLLGYGVPTEWLADVRAATEDSILTIADHLPAEAAEALLELAVGGTPRKAQLAAPATSPFDHPDAQRRFRVVSDVDELARALEYPWEKWTVFLHPAQRELVERRFGGPARVSGSAGTGKTIVALHRAAILARTNPDARVLLTTFSDSLASALRVKLHRLIGMEPRVAERIEVHAIDAVARRLYDRSIGAANVASADVIRDLVKDVAAASPNHKFSLGFLVSEWTEIVDAWQLKTWEAYRDVARLGRKTRLPEKARQSLWAIFERVRAALDARGLGTQADLYGRLASHIVNVRNAPYDFVVVDEAQDVSVPQLRFIAALGAARPDALFFAGDLGQRIFQLPFSWKSLGVDIRGRAGTLRINYRTSHQIRSQADHLLGKLVADVDGNVDDRSGTISVYNGPAPVVKVVGGPDEERVLVQQWINERISDGVKPDELAVFVRSAAQVARATAAVEASGVPFTLLDERMETSRGRVSIGTMHLSKGLEFRGVVVMACDDEVMPLQERVAAVTDEADLEEVYNTERHLLYVACTRARDHLLVTGVEPASEFLEDLRLN